MELNYDFHLHSCLSPCGDNDMTPYNLVNMAKIMGLDVIALTDHNTCLNCPAAIKAGQEAGILVIPGMELCTDEEVHVVCLFPDLEKALAFSGYVRERIPPVKNRSEIFGEQLILDGEDNLVGKEENLLSVATDISIEGISGFVNSFGGICYPAHIDRDSNGIIAVLGTLPDSLGFKTVEFRDRENIKQYSKKFNLSKMTAVTNSDAHFLTGICDKENYFDLPDGLSSSSEIRAELFKLLR